MEVALKDWAKRCIYVRKVHGINATCLPHPEADGSTLSYNDYHNHVEKKTVEGVETETTTMQPLDVFINPDKTYDVTTEFGQKTPEGGLILFPSTTVQKLVTMASVIDAIYNALDGGVVHSLQHYLIENLEIRTKFIFEDNGTILEKKGKQYVVFSKCSDDDAQLIRLIKAHTFDMYIQHRDAVKV